MLNNPEYGDLYFGEGQAIMYQESFVSEKKLAYDGFTMFWCDDETIICHPGFDARLR